MKLFERLGIRDPSSAAIVTLQEYVSNRSVALLLGSDDGALDLGSGTCVKIGTRWLMATAAHNVDGAEQQLEIVPAGDRGAQRLHLLRMGKATAVDVAWLELDARECASSRLRFVALDQIAPLREEVAVHVCLLQGYPAGSAERPSD